MAEETKSMDKKVAFGLSENIAGALSYVLGVLTAVIFILVEKENKFVRFHAFQSLFTFGGLFVVSIVLSVVASLGGLFFLAIALLVANLLNLVGILLWIFLMYKAYSGEKYQLPFVGKLAEKYA